MPKVALRVEWKADPKEQQLAVRKAVTTVDSTVGSTVAPRAAKMAARSAARTVVLWVGQKAVRLVVQWADSMADWTVG